MSDPGNSSGPPSSVPAYITVLVSSSITKSGPVISGNIPKMVIVKTDPGYAANPGHAGTGIVVAIVCNTTSASTGTTNSFSVEPGMWWLFRMLHVS